MRRSRLGIARTLVVGAWLAAMLVLGCASPGPPQPPSLHLPSLADRLQARRVADEVRLTWVTPADTTDGLQVSAPMVAVVCRELRRPGTRANSTSPCDPVKRMAVALGPAEIVDVLPQTLSTGAPALLAYRVELLNGRGRSAGPSGPVYAAAGGAPPPVGTLTISPRRGAALIQWQPQRADSAEETTLELHRTLAASAQGPAPPASQTGRTATPPVRRLPSALKPLSATAFGANREPPAEVTLAARAGDRGSTGGTLDPTVHDGITYVYVAQRVRKVTLGGEILELRGAPSPPATFTFNDTLPPQPPSGLVSVPGGGFGAPPSIDLSWEPATESDLRGYNVYRRTASGAFRKLNAEPIPSSSFRDMEVAPGHAYSYRVTAVDRRLNESAPSSEIHESLRQ